MRPVHLFLAVFLVGCASSSGGEAMLGSGVQAPASDNPTGTGGEFRLPADIVTATLEVDVPADLAWPALKAVYEELKISTPEVSETAKTVRNLRFVVSRRLGGERLSRFLDCGRSATGPNANTHRLELEIASRVVSLGPEKSRIDTEITGTGMNIEGTSNTRVLCTSTHQLELRIAARVGELAGGG